MAWFDGTFTTKSNELEEKFPIVITEHLRTNNERSKIAIINDFPKDSGLYEFTDPHLELDVYESITFYHIFIGDEADKAKEAIHDFVAAGHGKGEYEVNLYRKEDDGLFMYSHGELHPESPFPLWEISCQKETYGNKFYVLPLKVYAFECPVCKARTLQYPGMFEICTFCGWEDEGMMSEDEESIGANGDHSIKTYREEYGNKLKEYSSKLWRPAKERSSFSDFLYEEHKTLFQSSVESQKTKVKELLLPYLDNGMPPAIENLVDRVCTSPILGGMEEPAFQVAVMAGMADYVEDHFEDVDPIEPDGTCNYISLTDNEEIINMFIEAGAIHDFSWFDTFKFAVETENGTILGFDRDFIYGEVFKKYLDNNGLTEADIIEYLSADGETDNDKFPVDLSVVLDAFLIDVKDGELVYRDPFAADVTGGDFMEIIEGLGYEFEVEGDEDNPESICVYYIK